jgi:hypothetical protein
MQKPAFTLVPTVESRRPGTQRLRLPDQAGGGKIAFNAAFISGMFVKAFLSHSSKDKAFVCSVADRLGLSRCEYDEYTFEFTLNADSIRRALKRCNLFVFFLSGNSIRSDFVAEELRAALEARASGLIRKVLIFSRDRDVYFAHPFRKQIVGCANITW